MTAAATSRVGSGGRNVATYAQPRVEDLSFAPNIGVNEESILHYRQQSQFEEGTGKRRRDDSRSGVFTPLIMRNLLAYQATESDPGSDNPDANFRSDMVRGIGAYETSLRATAPPSVRPGSVLNYLY
ncbi:MAG: hypothetical protein ACM31L_10410 [Actinomycetota bacterium]